MFDQKKFYLGKLCPRGHDYEGTGKSLRILSSGHCVLCNRERSLAYSKTEAGAARRAAYQESYKERGRERVTAWLEKNRDRVNYLRRRRRARNPEATKATARKDYEAVSADPIRKQKRLETQRRWIKENPEAVKRLRDEFNRKLKETDPKRYTTRYRKTRRKYIREHPEIRRKSQKKFRDKNPVPARIRCRFADAMKRLSIGGKVMTSKKYGIDFAAIASHLGPCPGEKSDFHIDHIIPLSLFDLDNPEHVKIAFAPENHQWLPAAENRKKRHSLPKTCPPGLERQYELAVLNLGKRARYKINE